VLFRRAIYFILAVVLSTVPSRHVSGILIEGVIMINHPFSRHTILVTACPGVAATMLRGQTAHKASHSMKDPKNISEEDKIIFDNSVRMVVCDELSLLPPTHISKASPRANLSRGVIGYYGNLDWLWLGDFRQLVPPDMRPAYDSPPAEFITNCFIELDGRHRFKKDSKYGDLLRRSHAGCPTDDDFDTIDTRVVSDRLPLPVGTRVGCKTNAEREAVNVGTWLGHSKDHGEDKGLAVLADEVGVRLDSAKDTKLHDLLTSWTKVGECDCETHGRQVHSHA